MPNLLQKASIVLTPTAYNNGEALCIKPDDGSGDFDFSRNSAATRVNAQGLVENVQILSSNLVQNGDFSEEGAEEVSNGSFSQEGVELVTNGSFDTDSDWVKGTGWSIANGKAIKTEGNSGFLSQNAGLVVGKNYKATFTISNVTNGSLNLMADFSTSVQSFTSDGDYIVYYQPNGANLVFLSNATFNGSIDNVSCVEVGQDWTLGTGWSIGEDKAVADGSDPAVSGWLRQNNILTAGKTYTFSCSVETSDSGLVGSVNDFYGKFLDIDNGSGEYTATFTAVGRGIAIAQRAGKSFSITNISVKEVGQNWDLGDGWSIAENKAVSDGTINKDIYQVSVTTSGKTYKYSFDVLDVASGVLDARFRNGSGGVVVNFSSEGTYTGTFVAYGSRASFVTLSGNTASYSITNISVIEITDDTNLPRINYEGFSYQDALGSEQIVNGDFATDTAWLKQTGWTISGGKANSAASVGSVYKNPQTYVLGKSYKVTYTISDYVSGSLRVVWGSYIGITNNSNGTYTEIMTPTGANQFYLAASGGAFTGSIDNVSVKEYLGQEVVPDSGCGSWLFEPQSTNLIPYSEDFSNAAWGKISASVISNVIASPSGEINASKIVENNTNNFHFIQEYISVLSGANTFSFYAKADERTQVSAFFNQSGNNGGLFDLSAETATPSGTGNTANIESVGNGWYRCVVSNDGSSQISNQVRIGTNNGALGSYQGDGTSGVYIWGAQVEQQSYATSYIPTSGSSVTRNQDVCTNGGSLASINSTEGVLYAEIAALANDGTDNALSINNGSQTDRIWLGYSTAANRIYALGYTNSVVQFVMFKNLPTDTDMIKVAVKYKENDFALWVNGIEEATATSGLTPIGLNSVDFFINGIGSRKFFGKTKALAVWKEALSDEELTLLTAPAPVAPTFTLDFDEIANQFTFNRASLGTIVNEQGLIETDIQNNIPRIDYSTGAEAFLLEPQSTNHCIFSEQPSVWHSSGNVTITANAETSPQGILNASTVVNTTTNAYVRNLFYFSSSAATLDVTTSFFIKYTNNQWVYLRPNFFNGGSNSRTWFDIQNGVLGTNNNVSSSIKDFGNGWYRCSVTHQIAPATDTNGYVHIYACDNDNSTTQVIGQGFAAFGSQSEEFSYSTSYIPTSGTRVTRVGETCVNATPEINSEEGVLYAEISAFANDGSIRRLSLSDGTNNNRVFIGYSSVNTIQIVVQSLGTISVNQTFTLTDITQFSKIAFKYKENDCSFWIDGVKVGTDTIAAMPIGLNQLMFAQGDIARPFYGNTKDIQIFNEALSDYQLAQLTTI